MTSSFCARKVQMARLMDEVVEKGGSLILNRRFQTRSTIASFARVYSNVILFIKHKTTSFGIFPTRCLTGDHVIEILLFLDPEREFNRRNDKNFPNTHVYGDAFHSPVCSTNMNLL